VDGVIPDDLGRNDGENQMRLDAEKRAEEVDVLVFFSHFVDYTVRAFSEDREKWSPGVQQASVNQEKLDRLKRELQYDSMKENTQKAKDNLDRFLALQHEVRLQRKHCADAKELKTLVGHWTEDTSALEQLDVSAAEATTTYENLFDQIGYTLVFVNFSVIGLVARSGFELTLTRRSCVSYVRVCTVSCCHFFQCSFSPASTDAAPPMIVMLSGIRWGGCRSAHI